MPEHLLCALDPVLSRNILAQMAGEGFETKGGKDTQREENPYPQRRRGNKDYIKQGLRFNSIY